MFIKCYLTNLKNLLQRGFPSQLNHIMDALPTTLSSGTKPQNLLSCDW